MSLLLLSNFTRQATCKYLSIRNISWIQILHSSSFKFMFTGRQMAYDFLKQTIKSPNKAKDEKEYEDRKTTIY